MAIRLVAVDVDGTLVTADQRVLPRVQAAAQRALEHGIQLVLCTGRAPGECWYILDALPQIRYAVTQTGAIAQDLKTGETLYHCPLSPDDARLIYSHVRRYDGLVNFFSGGIVYNSKEQMARFERYYPADFRWHARYICHAHGFSRQPDRLDTVTASECLEITRRTRSTGR